MRVKHVTIEHLENPGCNNGNYPRVIFGFDGRWYKGLTCGCGRGCANTWNVDGIEEWDFKDESELMLFLEHDYDFMTGKE